MYLFIAYLVFFLCFFVVSIVKCEGALFGVGIHAQRVFVFFDVWIESSVWEFFDCFFFLIEQVRFGYHERVRDEVEEFIVELLLEVQVIGFVEHKLHILLEVLDRFLRLVCSEYIIFLSLQKRKTNKIFKKGLQYSRVTTASCS